MDPFSLVVGIGCGLLSCRIAGRVRSREAAEDALRIWDRMAGQIRDRETVIRRQAGELRDLRAEVDLLGRRLSERDHTITCLHAEVDVLVRECQELSDEAFLLLENPHEVRRCYETAADVGCSFKGDYGRLADQNAPEVLP